MSLEVLVKEGISLPLVEKSGVQSTMVVVNFQGYSIKSKVFDNDLNPKWNEMFTFPLGKRGITEDDFVDIIVYTFRTDARGKVIGNGRYHASPLLDNPQQTKQIKLKDSLGVENGGSILARYTLTPNAEPFDPSRATRVAQPMDQASLSVVKDVYQIRFLIHEARQLTHTPCDPVVVLTIGKETKSTQIYEDSINPVYNEAISFVTYSSPFDIAKDVVHLRVLNTLRLEDASLVGEFKFVMMTAFQSDPIGWDEPAYLSNDACRTMFRKWLIITHPTESPKNIKGFVNLSMSIMASGQKLLAPPQVEPLLLNVFSNVMRPSEVNAQYQRLVVRILHCEDVAPMSAEDDVALVDPRLQRLALTDPYVAVSYSGVEGLTDLIYAEYNPVFFQDIIFNIEIPSVTDTLIIRLVDRDVDGDDDIISTYFLKLESISYFSQDEVGFDPTFGPCFINFNGAPREITEHNEKLIYLNDGWVPGVAFRGRLFMEIFTKPSYSVGVSCKVQPSAPDAQAKSDRYLNRTKFVIAACFLEATMIEQADSGVTFEVSCGEFGNANSKSVDRTNSNTQATQPLYDSTRYYYLNWDAAAPAALVVCEWEDVIFRLETLNLLQRIFDKFEADIADVDDAIQLELTDRTIKSKMKNSLRDLIEKLKMELPELPDHCNELDKKLRALRRFRMDEISKKAAKMIKDVNPSRDFYNEMLVLLEKVGVVCEEPQSDIPEVVIWMIMNNIKIGYYKAPIHWFLESRDARGKYCGTTRHVPFRYLGGDPSAIATLVKCYLWFGSLEQFYKWRVPYSGTYTAFAETYENQVVMGEGNWTSKGLQRPEFSDANGLLSLPKINFECPTGWFWVSDWAISPDFSSIVGEDFGLDSYRDEVFEVQTIEIGDDWSDPKLFWMNSRMELTTPRDDVELPEGWEVTEDWRVETSYPGDVEGYQYAIDPDSNDYCSSSKSYHLCRRRLWLRSRVKVGASKIPTIEESVEKTEGWEYAKMFTTKFHSGEMGSDIVRRRRYRRQLDSYNFGPMTFTMVLNSKKIKVPAQVLVTFPEKHTFEVRVHIYSGRAFTSPDVSGYCNTYCCVSVARQTQNTVTIWQQLSPCWDQTLVYKDIQIVGNIREIREALPQVTINVYHRGPLGDEHLGTVTGIPKESFGKPYEPAKLKWIPIIKNDENAGDVLAAFEIFWTSKPELDPDDLKKQTGKKAKAVDEMLLEPEDIPFDPPRHPSGNGYQVPPGIRPILKNTRIEVLSWGLRHLKFWAKKPIDNPLLEIECGGTMLTLPKIPDLVNLPNFPQTSHYFDVLLPQGFTYKPPINIRLLDQRANGFTPLVGKYVLKSFSQYDPEYLKKKLAAAEAEGSSTTEESEGTPENAESISITETETVIVIEEEEDDGCCNCCCFAPKKPPAPPGPIPIIDESDDWEFLSMYWWSRYYAMQGNKLIYKTFKKHELPLLVVYEKEIELYFNNFSDSIQQFNMLRTEKLGGDPDEDEDDEKDPHTGMYKGSFRIYELSNDGDDRDLIYGSVPTAGSIRISVRLYALQAIGLATPSRVKDKTCDPFITVTLGPKTIADTTSLMRRNRNPRFCKIYNMETLIPNHPELQVAIIDFESTEEGRDALIGQTKVDLEDRFLSIKRPICGLTERYMISGPHKWRDFMLPTQILDEFCTANTIPLPSYAKDGSNCVINDEMYTITEFEKHKENFEDTAIWGPLKERIALYVLLELGLVRDYAEKRKLINPVMPGVPQGRMLMFTDIFPYMESPPEPMNIDPPLPVEMELRLIVFDVTDVETVEEVPPEKPDADTLHDLMIKGQFAGDPEAQVSEIHPRAVNGNGAFNWRFLFNFGYAFLDRKRSIPGEIEDQMLDPILTISVVDGDPSVAPEPYAFLHLDLTYLPRGQPKEEWTVMEMIPGYVEPPPPTPDPLAEEEEEDEEPPPRPPKIQYLNLFKKKKSQGWWPMYKKIDGYLYKTGKIKLELEVMTKPQALQRPAGTGRSDPNENPEIDEPIRVSTEFPEIDVKVKTAKFVWKSPNKPKVILAGIAQLLGVVSFSVIYNLPSALISYLLSYIG